MDKNVFWRLEKMLGADERFLITIDEKTRKIKAKSVNFGSFLLNIIDDDNLTGKEKVMIASFASFNKGYKEARDKYEQEEE